MAVWAEWTPDMYLLTGYLLYLGRTTMEAVVRIIFSDDAKTPYLYRRTKSKYYGGNTDFSTFNKHTWEMDPDDYPLVQKVTHVMPFCLLENEE